VQSRVSRDHAQEDIPLPLRKNMIRKHTLSAAIASAVAALASVPAHAQQFSNFTPQTSSVAAGSLPESAPFRFGNSGITQQSIASRNAQLSAGQFNSGSWDMIDSNRTGANPGRYLFTVFETGQAGIQRTDRVTGQTATLWNAPTTSGAGSAVAFDASRWTPFGTYLTAEESWGTQPQQYGRLFQLSNPITATAGTGVVNHVNAVARVSHEGLVFDKSNNLYYIDETNGGSIYKYTSATPNTGSTFFSGGTNSVLRVGTGNVDNATGASTWVPFTAANSQALAGAVTITDPNGVISVDGRATTDLAAFKGTNYQRPEDLEIQTLANGDQIVYVATTTTNEVYSINLRTGVTSLAVSRNTIDAATGVAVGSAFTSPDNLAIDSLGNMYIVEDQPGGSADIWFMTDTNRDGIAESISRWASMSTVGAEPTGLFFDPFNPNLAFVNVQHPSSGNDQLFQLSVGSAVPLPGTAAILLGGLGLFGFMQKRKMTTAAV
jgi:uncharacterized protein